MDETQKTANIAHWKFFGLVFIFTWLFWFLAGIDYLERFGVLTRILHYVGGVVPTLVALYLLYRFKNSTEQKNTGNGWSIIGVSVKFGMRLSS